MKKRRCEAIPANAAKEVWRSIDVVASGFWYLRKMKCTSNRKGNAAEHYWVLQGKET